MGYLSKLESRLHETETALLEALTLLWGPKSTASNEPSTEKPSRAQTLNQSKSTRMHEWEEFPLLDTEQLRKWWRAKSSDASMPFPADLSESVRIDDTLPDPDPPDPPAEENQEQMDVLMGDEQVYAYSAGDDSSDIPLPVVQHLVSPDNNQQSPTHSSLPNLEFRDSYIQAGEPRVSFDTVFQPESASSRPAVLPHITAPPPSHNLRNSMTEISSNDNIPLEGGKAANLTRLNWQTYF